MDAHLVTVFALLTIVFYQGYMVLAATNHVPHFQDSFLWERILEEQPIGTFLMKAIAMDSNGDDIVYSINDPGGYFTIDSKSGNVTTAKIIDREKLPQKSSSFIKFEIIASEVKRPDQKSSPLTIDVLIMDINDNQPIFEQSKYVVNISENVPPGSFVIAVKATDLDQTPELLYQIVEGNDAGFFTIPNHYAGLIRTHTKLDYEHIKEFKLTVEVADDRPNVGTRKKSYAEVFIFVGDEDDRGPYFVANYSTSLIEGYHLGQQIARVHAKDGDVGLNAPLKYSLDERTNTDHLFSINSNTGDVFVHGDIDREKDPFFKLRLLVEEVSSTGARHPQGTAELMITVLDVNDNQPQFELHNYVVHVSEHTKIGSIILHVKATDKDLGENALFEYLLEGEEDMFSISEGGAISLKKTLDREIKYDYNFKVIARQKGSQDSKADVHVLVQDENDHHPVFTKATYESQVQENVPAGVYITTVSATDKDIHENADISYRILPDAEGNTQCFHIDSKSGEIRTQCRFDREKKAEYLFLVQATDNGKKKELTSDVKISVAVLDVNDERPVFKEISFHKSVNYDEKINSPVAKLEATDPDTGMFGKVSYRIIRGNNDDRFHIDSATGILKVGDSLAAYSNRIVELVIEAYDNNGKIPTQSSVQNAIVTVTIERRGDNSVVLKIWKPVNFVLEHAKEIENDLKVILKIGIEVDEIEKDRKIDNTNFIFHGYDKVTHTITPKAEIVRELKSSRSDDMVRFRVRWNITSITEQDTTIQPINNKAIVITNNEKKNAINKWHPIIYAVLGFSALIAIFGTIGIIYLIKTKRRHKHDNASASLTLSSIPIAAREQARKLWADDNFESVSQFGAPQESYVTSSGFLQRSCDRYELDPSNLYSKQDMYSDDPFSEIGRSPAHSSDGSHSDRASSTDRASSIFAASSVMTVITAYNNSSNRDRMRNSLSKKPKQNLNSFISPRDRKLSVILDDEKKSRTYLEPEEELLMRRPPSYDYDLDEKLASQFDCDV